MTAKYNPVQGVIRVYPLLPGSVFPWPAVNAGISRNVQIIQWTGENFEGLMGKGVRRWGVREPGRVPDFTGIVLTTFGGRD
jgi:hypothetical protein